MRNTNKKTIENFLNNVKWLRTTNNLSKKEMCKILGIGINSLNKIEKGILPQKISVRVLFSIKDYFGISANNILGEKLYK